VDDSEGWQGLGASPGTATGTAKIVRTEEDFRGVSGEHILVARHATPALFPPLARARAAVCETGGLLSHLAVLARELNKPCVTGLAGIVDALAPGIELYVDGTRGLVRPASASRPRLPRPDRAGATESMVALLRFGGFSPAFAPTATFLDLDMALRIAALISLPARLGGDPAWEFAVDENRLLVPAQSLSDTTDALVSRFERDSRASRELHHRYTELCAWPGWSSLDGSALDVRHLGTAVRHYITLNQLTWVASVAKERLVQRYRTFLRDRLTHLDEARRESLFLDSLITSDRSYIARAHFTNREGERPWSDGCEGAAPATAWPRTSGAQGQYVAAVQDLRRQLGPGEFQRVARYLSALDDLVDLTERKNTDLHRRANVLFGDLRRRDAVAWLLGVGDAGGPADESAEARRRLIETVVARLGDLGSLAPWEHGWRSPGRPGGFAEE
jgi:pyruvate,water dikinase